MRFPEKLGSVFTISLVIGILVIIYVLSSYFFPSLACFVPETVCDLISKIGDWVSLITGISAIGIAVFTYLHDKKINRITTEQLKNIDAGIEKINDFENRQRMYLEEVIAKQKAKQRRYADAILAMISFESDPLENIKREQKFRKQEVMANLKKFARKRDDIDRKESQLREYSRMQSIFLGLKMKHDTLLDVFDEKILEIYRKTWLPMSPDADLRRGLWDDPYYVDKVISPLEKNFKELKDALLPYSSKNSNTEQI